jgi:small-conductance mechanosensitive channel
MTFKSAYSHIPDWLRKYLPVLVFGVLTYLAGATDILSQEVHRFVYQSLNLWWTQFEPNLGKLLVAGLFVSVVRLLHDPVQTRMEKAMTSAGAEQRDKDIVAWVSRIAYWMLLVFGVSAIFGFDIFGKIFASVFGAGAVLAFALKDTVNDFFCGIYLRFNRHLNIGTYIEVIRREESFEGKITEFGFLESLLVDKNGKVTIVPNRIFWGAPIAKSQ